MSITFNGSTQYIHTTGTTITTYPFTLFCYFNPNGVAAECYAFDICNNTAAAINGFRMRAASTGLVRITVGDGSTTSAVSTSTSYSASTWQRMYYVGTSATSRSVYLNNGGVGNDTTNLTPTGINKTYVGVSNLNTVLSNFYAGSLAHITIANVAATATQRAMLESGVHPLQVFGSAIASYVPADDSSVAANDYLGLTWTQVATPTFGTSPGIIRNRYHL